MTAWTTAHIDERIQLAYIDSGPPDHSSDYSSVVCVHGHTYHSNVFLPLFPLASHHNLRIIAVNRRDYRGSTLFSEEELEQLFSDDSEQNNSFLKARGLEIALFLVWIINELKIPPKDTHGRGGLALLGWSLGNTTTLAFLRHLDSYPIQVIETLKPYLSDFYVYDFSYNGLGYPSPPETFHPLFDDTVKPADRFKTFHDYLVAYHTHPYYATNPPTLEKKMSSLHMRMPTNPTRPPSHFTPDDLSKCTDLAPGDRSEVAFYPTHKSILPVFRDQRLGALIFENVDSSKDVLRDIKVHVFYCTASTWSVIWGAWELEKETDVWKTEGRITRPLNIIVLDGENHFFHYDDPEAFLKLIARRQEV